MPWDRRAPFDKDGNLMHYPLLHHMSGWRDVTEFDATLCYKGYARGRSAAYFLFTDLDGHEWPMFLKEFDAAVKHLCNGRITGQWTITKRGQNFGIKLLSACEVCR